MGKIVVTGVSSGIGEGVLRYFVSKGFHVFGSVRNRKDAQKIKKTYGENFTPIIFDVTKESQIKSAAVLVKKKLKHENILALVNNSGIAIGGPLLHQKTKDFEKQIDVNLNGMFRVIKHFAPLCGAQKNNKFKKGVIFNISSISGKLAVPGTGAYSASKFGVEGLSHSLRRELLRYAIDVVIIGPGPIRSKIFNKVDRKFFNSLKKTDYSSAAKSVLKRNKEMLKISLPAEDVGKLIYDALHSFNRKTRYTITPNRLKYWTIPRLLPDRVLDGYFKKNIA